MGSRPRASSNRYFLVSTPKTDPFDRFTSPKTLRLKETKKLHVDLYLKYFVLSESYTLRIKQLFNPSFGDTGVSPCTKKNANSNHNEQAQWYKSIESCVRVFFSSCDRLRCCDFLIAVHVFSEVSTGCDIDVTEICCNFQMSNLKGKICLITINH